MEPAEPQAETLRLHQANERTLLAWVRTGIALMGFGFAIARFGLFLREVAEAGRLDAHATQGLGSSWAGVVLVALGMLTNLSATVRYALVRRAIGRGQVGAPRPTLVYVVGGTATLVGLLLTVLLSRALER